MMNYLLMIIASSVTLAVVLAVVLIAYTLFLLAKEVRDDGLCEWSRMSCDDDDYGDYNACSGNSFHNSTDNGECVTSWANFCPYCGKRIKVCKL